MVSTLRIVVTPSWSLRGSQTNCGVSRKTGSMTLAASSMRATEMDASMARGV